MKKLFVSFTVLLLLIPVFASVKYFGSAATGVGVLTYIPFSDYIDTENEPFRTAFAFNTNLDFMSFNPGNNYGFSFGCGLDYTSRSRAVEGIFIKPFFAIGPYFSIDHTFDNTWALSNAFKFMFGFFQPLNEKFAYIGYSVSVSREVSICDTLKTRIMIPLDLTYKNDMFSVSFGLGMKVECK